MLALAKEARNVTGCENLCMAGGCALNCVGNGLISREMIFKRIFVQPAAGDAGGSLGAALMTWHEILKHARIPKPSDSQQGSLLGPSFSNEEIEPMLQILGAPYVRYSDDNLPATVAGLIDQGQVVGFFHGRMEFGPRALGSRSILGDARRRDMQTVMNVKIKFRESFRPFAPAVLEECANDYFELNQDSPYMLLVGPVRPKYRKEVSASASKSGLALLELERSTIPAVTHADYSARVQTVNEERFGMFYRILKAFYQLSGCPVIINTSFNIRGEPIVNTPQEAYRCFMYTDMDALVLENCVLLKSGQPDMPGAEEYKRKYKKQD